MGVAVAEITTAICSAVAILATIVGMLSSNFRHLRQVIDSNHQEVITRLTAIQSTQAEHGARINSLEDTVRDHGARIDRLEHGALRPVAEERRR